MDNKEEPKKVPFSEFKQGFRNSLSAAKQDIENARRNSIHEKKS